MFELNERQQAEFDIIAARMDRQQRYFDELYRFVDANGAENLPPEHNIGWLRARQSGRKNWRLNPRVVNKIVKAAKKAAKKRA
jgi:hypothetical protein